ncbi:hypothetical protein [Robiginitomaculum antarcticum]|uniref:hypothetical protein n=1 Tax=Robiginitomaculum antarcticum TaxID=437507 RepID=UPI00037A5F56|nr:hypothetical protein [Robiginitomaculum antarcticum]
MKIKLSFKIIILAQIINVSCGKADSIYITNITSECTYKNDTILVNSMSEDIGQQKVIITADGLEFDREIDKTNKTIPWSFVEMLAVQAKRENGTVLTSVHLEKENWIVGALDKKCFDKFTDFAPRRIGIVTTVTLTRN